MSKAKILLPLSLCYRAWQRETAVYQLTVLMKLGYQMTSWDQMTNLLEHIAFAKNLKHPGNSAEKLECSIASVRNIVSFHETWKFAV